MYSEFNRTVRERFERINVYGSGRKEIRSFWKCCEEMAKVIISGVRIVDYYKRLPTVGRGFDYPTPHLCRLLVRDSARNAEGWTS